MENKIINSLLAAAFGGLAYKVFKAAKNFKEQKEEYDELIDDLENE